MLFRNSHIPHLCWERRISLSKISSSEFTALLKRNCTKACFAALLFFLFAKSHQFVSITIAFLTIPHNLWLKWRFKMLISFKYFFGLVSHQANSCSESAMKTLEYKLNLFKTKGQFPLLRKIFHGNLHEATSANEISSFRFSRKISFGGMWP